MVFSKGYLKSRLIQTGYLSRKILCFNYQKVLIKKLDASF